MSAYERTCAHCGASAITRPWRLRPTRIDARLCERCVRRLHRAMDGDPDCTHMLRALAKGKDHQ